jgi:hypothetical protein
MRATWSFDDNSFHALMRGTLSDKCGSRISSASCNRRCRCENRCDPRETVPERVGACEGIGGEVSATGTVEQDVIR